MNQEIQKNPERVDFKQKANELYGIITQLSGIIEVEDNVAAASRSRAETAATLLKELPGELDENMVEFRTKILHECQQGISTIKPLNEFDENLIEQAKNIIEKLEQN